MTIEELKAQATLRVSVLEQEHEVAARNKLIAQAQLKNAEAQEAFTMGKLSEARLTLKQLSQ